LGFQNDPDGLPNEKSQTKTAVGPCRDRFRADVIARPGVRVTPKSRIRDRFRLAQTFVPNASRQTHRRQIEVNVELVFRDGYLSGKCVEARSAQEILRTAEDTHVVCARIDDASIPPTRICRNLSVKFATLRSAGNPRSEDWGRTTISRDSA